MGDYFIQYCSFTHLADNFREKEITQKYGIFWFSFGKKYSDVRLAIMFLLNDILYSHHILNNTFQHRTTCSALQNGSIKVKVFHSCKIFTKTDVGSLICCNSKSVFFVFENVAF